VSYTNQVPMLSTITAFWYLQ